MKDNKRVKILLKIIQRICYKNLEIQDVINASMIELCPEEGVSPEQVFFILVFLSCCLYHNGCSRKKSKQESLRLEILMEILVVT